MSRPVILYQVFNESFLSWRFLLTSGKFEQILAMASRTDNCISENPLVSISVFEFCFADTENDLERET